MWVFPLRAVSRTYWVLSLDHLISFLICHRVVVWGSRAVDKKSRAGEIDLRRYPHRG